MQAPITDAGTGETRSRRGRRGGRRERRPEQDQATPVAGTVITQTDGAEVGTGIEAMAQPVVTAPLNEPIPVVVTPPPTTIVTAPVEASATARRETSTVAVASETLPAVPKAEAVKAVMPVEKRLSEMLAPSPAAAQLQQVETQSKPAVASVTEAPQQAPRRRREPLAMVADIPVELMQVETNNSVTAPVESANESNNPAPKIRAARRATTQQQSAPEAPLQQIETRQ